MTLSRVAVVAIVLATLVSACSRPAPREAPRDHLIGDASARASASHRASSRDEAMEKKLLEMDAVHDWRNTIYGSRAPNPPIKARARGVPKKAPFRTGAVASVRAYHYRHSFSNDGYIEFGETSLDLPFTRDGRLDGHVIGPEAELTEDEQRRVLALISDAEDERNTKTSGYVASRALMQCDFAAHHVLVLFDVEGIPIGKIFVCMTCHELQMLPALPAMGGSRPGAMSTFERETFKAILDAHGLAAWTYDDDDPTGKAVRAYEERVYGARGEYTAAGNARNAQRAVRPSGVDPNQNARGLPKSEREHFCVWFEGELVDRASRRRDDHQAFGNYECTNGQGYFLSRETMATCATQRICGAPMGRIEACLRASFLDGPQRPCTSGPGPECDGLLDCLPGVVWRK